MGKLANTSCPDLDLQPKWLSRFMSLDCCKLCACALGDANAVLRQLVQQDMCTVVIAVGVAVVAPAAGVGECEGWSGNEICQ
eukprot:1293939-Alexandrium_andersonii.AAC.1